VFEVNKRKFEVDKDGFLQSPEIWDRAVALDLANAQGLTELSEGHWKIIDYIRGYWKENEIAPMVRHICKETGYKLSDIYDMFPSGPAKGACKVAGLPNPSGCV
jgi:tRNA 2-thiouridine synthesizing protein E